MTGQKRPNRGKRDLCIFFMRPNDAVDQLDHLNLIFPTWRGGGLDLRYNLLFCVPLLGLFSANFLE